MFGRKKKEAEQVIAPETVAVKTAAAETEALADLETAKAFLSGLLEKMNLKADIEGSEDEERITVRLSGADSGSIIGYRGDVLDAISYLVSLAVGRGSESRKKVTVDCCGYRAKRTDILVGLAERLASRAAETGRKVRLEPMNSAERRVIHSALSERAGVRTESEGEEPSRYVVIIPDNYDPSKDRGAFRQGGFNRDRNGGGRREGFGRDRNSGGFNRDRSSGGFNRDRSSGGSRDGSYGGGRRDSRDSRDSRGGARPPQKSSGFTGFGTYLGNSKSNFSGNESNKNSGFDNLKD